MKLGFANGTLRSREADVTDEVITPRAAALRGHHSSRHWRRAWLYGGIKTLDVQLLLKLRLVSLVSAIERTVRHRHPAIGIFFKRPLEAIPSRERWAPPGTAPSASGRVAG